MAWAPDYVELDRMRSLLRISSDSDTADDVHLRVSIAAASRAVDRACNRQFGQVTTSTTRRYTAFYSNTRGKYVVEIDDLYSTSGLAVTNDGTALTITTDYYLLPLNAAADGKPYTKIVFEGSVSTGEGDISIASAKWGWETIPLNIVEATGLQAARFVKRRDAPFGIAGSPEMGNELRLLAKLDPDVEVLVAPYRRWWGAY